MLLLNPLNVISILDLSTTSLGNKGLSSLLKCLKQGASSFPSPLVSLNVQRNEFHLSLSIAKLLSEIILIGNLEHLDLSHNYIGDEQVTIISENL